MSTPATLVVAESRIPRREAQAVVPQGDQSIMSVIAAAARDPNIDVDKMLKLYDIRDRELARVAEREFIAAMAEFKANPPKIIKDKHVAFQTSKGMTEYDHATLASVVGAIIDSLAKVGISHRWDTEQKDGGRITVTCVLTHEGGFSTRTALSASPDDSGGKNNIQAIGSTVTYLQRYTLMAATGLAAGMPDDDGRGGNGSECVSADQAANLQALVEEVGANRANFLAYFKVQAIADIPANKYSEAVRMLEAKRKGARR